MKITKEKVIPGKIDLNSEELDIVVDFKIVLERISRLMTANNIDRAGTITSEQVEDLLHDVELFYNNVGVDYSADEVMIRRADKDVQGS